MQKSLTLCYPLTRRKTDEERDFREAIRLLLNADFRRVDYSPAGKGEEGRRKILREREMLNRSGILVEQSHAVSHRGRKDYDFDLFKKEFHESFETAVLLGARHIVVHADEYRVTDRYDEKEILEYTYDYLAPEVEYAIANNMNVAIESLFEEGNPNVGSVDGRSRFTSRIGELKAIIERFHDPRVGCCWDFGHSYLAYGYRGMTDALRAVGPYVLCTHVHDNYKQKDLHLRPFLGEILWEEQMKTLREIGYRGELNFELQYGGLPEEIWPLEMKILQATGDYLIELFEGKRTGEVPWV